MTKLKRDIYPIWPDYVKFGIIEYPPGGVLGPRIQHTYEFVFVHEGEMRLKIDDNNYHIGHNTATLLFPGHTEHYRFSNTEKTRHSFLHLSFPFMPKNMVSELYNLPRSISLSKHMGKFIINLSEFNNCELSTKDGLLKTQALSIFWLYLGEAESTGLQKAPQKSIVEDACRYIVSNLSEEISLAAVAQAVNICPEHLIRIFKSELNITPMKYVWQRRVSRGMDLLIHSGLLIGEIADRCGFKTRNHFSRKIFEETSYSPRDLRKIKWQNKSFDAH